MKRRNLLTFAIGMAALAAAAHPIDFDQIRHWTGSGPNRAALVIQYNGDKYGTDAYVWGYRWENGEQPTGEDMMKAICANSARLSMLTQYTGSMGSTLCGVGYGLNQSVLEHVFFNFDKAKDFEFINFDYYNPSSFMGQNEAPGDNSPAIAQAAIDKAIAGTHYIQHPFDYRTYGYPAYDYDCWDIDEDTENIGGPSSYEPKWLAAWYEGYWSYWCANAPSQDWMYSGSGFTGRTLVNGAVDGWSFTEFESAMVGGMGEGVAPCQDGTIVYMPAKLPSRSVDLAKCVRTVGSGELSLPLVICFGDDTKIDNIVVRLQFSGMLPSVSQVMTALGQDPAFTVEGSKLSFDDTSCTGNWQLTEYEDCAVLGRTDAAPEYLAYLAATGTEVELDGQPMLKGFAVSGIEGDVIVLNPKQMLGIIAEPVPSFATLPPYSVTLSGHGTAPSNYIASMYKVNYWDVNNKRIQFYELNGHRAGECTLTLTATDGSNISRTFTVRVEEQGRTPLVDGYVDGTLLLNEEWYGHTNGGMNYIAPDGEIMYQVYERENPGMSFGCTSQYGTIWGDKLIVVSKQAADGGDPLPGGGRVVLADARTLKWQGAIDDLRFGDETKSADGRAVVGATPGKAYVGTSNGIYIVDLEQVKITGKIANLGGASSNDLYSGQIGDMVNAGKYVFGIKQSTGAFAIDIENDQVVKTYPYTNIHGVTQTADGHVWLATVLDGRGRFVCIDPVTLEEVDDLSVTLPAGMPYPTCSWGAWRNTPFIGSHTRNIIWFSAGGGIAGGSATDKYYGWEVGSDPAALEPVFDMGTANLTGSHEKVKQKTYGTLRYDERSGQLIVMTTENSASGHYRYNWTHFVDVETGEIVRTIALRPYYWFQAFAIFPDKHDAVIALDEINVDLGSGAKTIDLSEFVSDADNIDANIKLALVQQPASVAQKAAAASKASVALEGKSLTVTPLAVGTHVFTLTAESNGRTVSKTVNVNVGNVSTGIDCASTGARTISCDGKRIYIKGFAGQTLSIYDMAGRMICAIDVDDDALVFDFGNHSGAYLIANDSDFSTKVIIR